MTSTLLSIVLLAGGPSLDALDSMRQELRPLLDALAIVESNNNDKAVGDGGRAIGRYQVWRVYWQDAVEHAPELGGEYQDVLSKEYAERVIVSYLHRYAKEAIAEGDFEKLARIHNGGPKGYKKRATVPYWNRVETHLTRCPFCGRFESL